MMFINRVKSAFITVRVTDATRRAFAAKTQSLGQPSEVLRELIEAFIEDRLIVKHVIGKGLKNDRRKA